LYLAAIHRSDIARQSIVTLPAHYLARYGIAKNGEALAIEALCGAGFDEDSLSHGRVHSES
jgi:hypothetical protein